jgi:hypothetical protein
MHQQNPRKQTGASPNLAERETNDIEELIQEK